MVDLVICSLNFIDQLALLSFKSSIKHDANNVLSNWRKETNICGWVGVLCSRRRHRVTGLLLGNMSLEGAISPLVGNIPLGLCHYQRLEVISLSGNKFSGRISKVLSTLPSPSVLAVEHNELIGTIPPSFDNISSLEKFGLEENHIYGNVPTELTQLPNLKLIYLVMKLSHNKLTFIPSSLWNLETLSISRVNGSFQSLNSLNLSRNSSSGPIPNIMGTLITLDFLDLSHNSLSGRIPKSLEALSHIQYMNFSCNKLAGEIPNEGLFMNLTSRYSWRMKHFVGILF
ncbi:hypothetical protein ACSBR2_018094 [Camellia fascicularis]